MTRSRPTGLSTPWALAALLALAFAPASDARAADTPDPAATRKALTSLLAAANDPVPRSSSCHANVGQPGATTVKDVLAMRMAYLFAGTNVIEGRCSPSACTVSIHHAAGEDVASATLSFTVSGGKARASSLQCVMTP